MRISTTSRDTTLLATRAVLRRLRKISSVSRSLPATIASLTFWWIARLDGAHEARAHVDAVGAQRQRGDQAAGVGEAAGGDHRDLDLLGGGRDQHQPGDVVLAGMAGALEAVDADAVDAEALRLHRRAAPRCTCAAP